MTAPTTADERRQRTHGVFDRLTSALLAHDMAAFADEWAPDGSMEFPFAPPDWPTVSGKDAVRQYLAGFPDNVDIRGIRHQTRHDTGDPDTIVVEWGVTGVATATGNPYDIDYVAVVTVGEQGITVYRDYWNPLAAAAAMGGLDDAVSAFDPGRPS
jgi:ketosteroid isomerase-like protein